MLRILFLSFLVILIAGVAGLSVAGESGDRNLADCPVRFVIIGDRTGEAQPGIYEQIVAEIERLKPEFVMTVGDQVEGPAPDSATLEARWLEYKSIVTPLSVPIYFTPGNNDITTEEDEGAWVRYTGNRLFYSFDYEGLHFIVLDNSRWFTVEEFPGEQIDWLIEDLQAHQEARHTFAFMHVPFWYRTLADGQDDTLHTIFKTFGVDAVFTGHFHRYFTGVFDGVKYTTVGSSGGHAERRPGDLDYHFLWVTVGDEDITMAPIQINGVREWDEVLVSDLRYYETVRRLGISFVDAAPVAESPLRVDKTTADVDIVNLAPTTLIDTIHWTAPEGWSIQPAELALEIPPGEAKRVSFEVQGSGDLYPLPAVNVDFPYKDTICSAQKWLRVARRADCEFVESPPVIDGVIDADLWQSTCPGLLDSQGKPAGMDSTSFYFAYDTDNLYLAVRCKESSMDSLKATMEERDDLVFQEDCVGFLYRPRGSEGNIYQLYVNPLGTAFDQEITQGSDGYWDGNQTWDGVYEIAAKLSDDSWAVEVRIPLHQFGASAASGQVWDFNFRRKQKRLDAAGGWQIPHGYDPNGFGQLVME